MTENEKIIEEANEIAKGRMYATNEVIRLQKELEQYRAIGTVEEMKELKKINADKIRAMSDEELAEFLLHFQHCDICDEQLEMYCTEECTKNIVKWLQSEAE